MKRQGSLKLLVSGWQKVGWARARDFCVRPSLLSELEMSFLLQLTSSVRRQRAPGSSLTTHHVAIIETRRKYRQDNIGSLNADTP